MKILFVVSDFSLGGITTACVNFCNELISRGHSVDVLNMSGDRNQRSSQLNSAVNILYLDKKRQLWNTTKLNISSKKGIFAKLKYLLIGLRKKLLTKKDKWLPAVFKRYTFNNVEYDVAFAYRQCAPCYYFTLRCVNAKKKICAVHGELKYMGDISSWKKYMQEFDKIAYVSKAVQKQFNERFPELEGNGHTIYNMFDVQKIMTMANETTPVIFDKGNINIVTIARIENDFKRIDWIPTICQELKKITRTPFRWYIVGDGPDYRQVENLIEDYGVGDCVTLTGVQENPYAILKQADFSVLLSKSEAYPMVVIESFILGVPIVVSRFDSIEEMMKNGKHGLIAESTMEDITEKVKRFLEEKQTLDSCKEFLKTQNFSNEIAYKQFTDAVGGEACIQ